ncbi:TPA: oxidoreductase [Pseudomonas aeruginosa]|nr:oxidoreductase [Pseudomonas aeruginosa]HBP5076975.1 oxidoreductase [Pseudomonas aeruginosa]
MRHLAPLFFIFYGCPDATRVEIGRLASVQNFNGPPENKNSTFSES